MMSEIFPTRISIMTFNIWGNHYWPTRRDSLTQLFVITQPDIILLQEVTIEILDFLTNILPYHKHIKSDVIRGWSTESNIFYDSRLFHLDSHGAVSLNIEEYPDRSLFWARLRLKAIPTIALLCSTAHLPWPGSITELSTGINQRIGCCQMICESLRELTVAEEVIFFAGDFNDDFHPLRILRESGFRDVFELLDLPPPITHPVRPSDPREESRPNRTLDWITCMLPESSKIIAAYAKQIRGGCHPPPSDHFPVVAVVEVNR